ncbi:MAG: GHKL domain-containing protein, partial [Deltaproteobacteria bacterium]|nr:GHKL domain-containing protein [Deltaproteobacteria bacterium]
TPFGALQVLNKKSGEAFTRPDLELLVGMSQQIAVAMENARLYQRLEKKFELTEQELKTTQEKLIRSERLMAMGHLVQGVAHEIRNPITTIGGFARRIKKALNEDNRLNEYIDIIVDESARLEKLVNEVREFADAQSASLSLDSIVDVMNEVSKKFKPLANRQDVKFEMDIAEDTPLINMDMSQLVSAMSNIIENALESMPDGGTLALKVIRKNDNLLISVRDTGCGIAGEQLEAVYDPFVTSKTRGAGLGLTMVHQIIMNHHGDIKISSDLDKGTLVTIRLPIS